MSRLAVQFLREAGGSAHCFDNDSVLREVFPRAAWYASMWGYYEVATMSRPTDLGMIETDADGRPVAAFVATRNAERISFFGGPAVLEIANPSNGDTRRRAGRQIAQCVMRDCEESQVGLHVVLVTDSAELSGFDEKLLQARASCTGLYSAEVDLDLAEDVLFSSLRKSTRSCINQGRSILTLRTADHEDPNPQLFDAFRTLHKEVAGRRTRPSESWDAMQRRLVSGDAQLTMGFLEERAVAAAFVMSYDKIAVYASAAYVRDLDKFPVSHWPLYAAILSAQRGGKRRFVLGDGYFNASSEASPKMQSIAKFKRGFASNITHHRSYELQRPRADS